MKVFCIIGDERAFSSKSPVIFSSVLKRVGIKGVYVPFKVYPDMIGSALHSLRVLNIDGANITVPYKELVIPHLDILSEGANIIGAINTIVCNNNKLKGYNTNAIGFMDTLEDIGFDVPGKTALVFGTGGAAKSVAFILNWLRADSITITGRNMEKAGVIASRFSGEARSLAEVTGRQVSADIVINATSVSSPDEAPELAELTSKMKISNCEHFIDLNYGRRKNFWKDTAEANNIQFMDGLPTLANQARRSFSLWTRIDVEAVEFLNALKDL